MPALLHRPFLALLLLAAAPAPRWVEIEDAAEEDVVVMYDRLSLRREGDLVTVWTLYDFADDGARGYQEARVQSQFDCRRKLSRTLYSVVYDASGKERDGAAKAPAFRPVVPDTTGETVMLHACAPPADRTATLPRDLI